ncbi:hypothetical protein ABZX88_33865, partial [Kitasatospora aureofaciens]
MAIDVRVGPAPVVRHDDDQNDQPAPHNNQPTLQPARPPLADSPAYQQLRQQMRQNAAARQAATNEAATAREEILRRHYNKLRANPSTSTARRSRTSRPWPKPPSPATPPSRCAPPASRSPPVPEVPYDQARSWAFSESATGSGACMPSTIAADDVYRRVRGHARPARPAAELTNQDTKEQPREHRADTEQRQAVDPATEQPPRVRGRPRDPREIEPGQGATPASAGPTGADRYAQLRAGSNRRAGLTQRPKRLSVTGETRFWITFRARATERHRSRDHERSWLTISSKTSG